VFIELIVALDGASCSVSNLQASEAPGGSGESASKSMTMGDSGRGVPTLQK
jgi:hypothetical protein